MTNSFATRLDRIEQQSTDRPHQFAWITRGETKEQAIARAASAHGCQKTSSRKLTS
jgi:hypothetical protein